MANDIGREDSETPAATGDSSVLLGLTGAQLGATVAGIVAAVVGVVALVFFIRRRRPEFASYSASDDGGRPPLPVW
jgi:hypothetical protein